MSDTNEFNINDIPYDWSKCFKLRRNLLLSFYEREDKTLDNFCRERANNYKRQGSAYGLLFVFLYVAVTYTKYKNMKPHKFGIILGSGFGYFVGGAGGLILSSKKVIEDIGIIKEDPELNKLREEIITRCKKY